jgi:uncharacterized protein
MITLKYHVILKYMFKRILKLPKRPKKSFFLWGPRQSGKSTLLLQLYPKAHWVDLLKTDEFIKYTRAPYKLRNELEEKKEGTIVVIDEIQKVPLLLDEVHWMIENKKFNFILCGSSARKVKRGHANLLGGRALRYQLYGLVTPEIQQEWNLNNILNKGYMPTHYTAKNYKDFHEAYVNTYLKEEIADEGLTRNLPIFANFLNIAAITDTEMLVYSNIARECAVSVPTVKEYYQILEDTLLGTFLMAYRKRAKRRLAHTPKFYFNDIGVVNFLASRGEIKQGSELFGKALENWVFHELSAYNSYKKKYAHITYWRTSGGTEVDFIVNDMEVAIEVKSSKNISSHHMKGLRELAKDYKVKKRIMVCTEQVPRQLEDGIKIYPAKHFAEQLWAGKLF